MSDQNKLLFWKETNAQFHLSDEHRWRTDPCTAPGDRRQRSFQYDSQGCIALLSLVERLGQCWSTEGTSYSLVAKHFFRGSAITGIRCSTSISLPQSLSRESHLILHLQIPTGIPSSQVKPSSSDRIVQLFSSSVASSSMVETGLNPLIGELEKKRFFLRPSIQVPRREWTSLICFISILRWFNDWRRRFTGLTRLEKIPTSTDQKRTSENSSTRETPRDDRPVHSTHIPRRRILSAILAMNLAIDPKETEERDLFHPSSVERNEKIHWWRAESLSSSSGQENFLCSCRRLWHRRWTSALGGHPEIERWKSRISSRVRRRSDRRAPCWSFTSTVRSKNEEI